MGNIAMIASVFILLTISPLLSLAANSLENGTNNNTNGDFISKVVSALAEFCPHQDLARVDNNTGRTDTGSCCTEFFDSDDTNSVTNQDRVYKAKPFQKCAFVQSQEPLMFTPTMSYFVVVDAPPDGCMVQINGHESPNEEEETLFEPRCDGDVSPWKWWFPVFSKSSALIYKTPQCAFCHGVHDLIYWVPTVACDDFSSIMYDMTSCDVFYDYPGNPDDVKHLQCFTSIFETCPLKNNDKLPPDISLTKNELVQACHMDALPPFNHIVHSKNLFCYICQYYKTGNYFPVKSCRTYNKVSNRNSFGSFAFTGIIDMFSLRKLDETAPTTEKRAPCIKFNNKTECHQVMCPVGQSWVKRGQERECAFELVQLSGTNLKVMLVLTSDQSFTIGGTELNTILTERQLTSPWPREWKISFLSRRVHVLPANTTRPNDINRINAPVTITATTTNQLLIELVHTKASFRPKEVLQAKDTAMKKTWKLNMNGKQIVFKQTMSRYQLRSVAVSNFTDTRRIFTVPTWYRMRYEATVALGPTPIFESVQGTLIRARSSNFITELFFCPQVELPASYFTVFRYDSFFPQALYHSVTGYLFDNEFHQHETSSGESYFRVCMYHVIEPKTSASVDQSSYSMTFKFLFIHFIFTVVTNY